MNTVQVANAITLSELGKAMTYEQYRKLILKLLQEGKTTGPDQSLKMIEYTALNNSRMHRLDRTIALLPELIDILQGMERKMYWLVLSEAWCGDAAQSIPIIAKMVDASPALEMGILLRDENPTVMQAHLTNGAHAIPKLIALDPEKLEVIGEWGPRPAEPQKIVMDYKAMPEPKENYSEVSKRVQMWYNADKGLSLQLEFIGLLKMWNSRKG